MVQHHALCQPHGDGEQPTGHDEHPRREGLLQRRHEPGQKVLHGFDDGDFGPSQLNVSNTAESFDG